MRCWIAVVAALSSFAPAVRAQELVRGTISDATTSRPVAGAEITAPGQAGRSWSDEKGHFRLALVRIPDTLRIVAIGYHELRLALSSNDVAVRLDPLPITLPDIVTMGGRWTERVAEQPAPITIMSQDEIAAQAAVALDQAVGELPGVQIQPAMPAGTTVSIRGIGEQRVLVLVDGEPTPGALLENQDLSRISLFDAERIEVTKGPTSSEYGSDAMGGVINVVTAPPSDGMQLDLAMRGGSFGRRDAEGALSAGGDRIGARVSGSVRQQDRLPGQRGDDAFERVWNVRGTIQYRANERLSLRADGTYLYERQRWPVGGGFNGFNDNQGMNGWAEGALDALGGRTRLRLFGQHYEYEFRSAQGQEPVAGTGVTQSEELWRGLLAHQRRLGAHTLDLGAQGTTRTVTAPDRLDPGTISDDQLELWVRDEWRRNPVLFSVGGRYTTNSRWGDNISPSIGGVWEPASALRVRLNVSRGFRPPSFKETGWRFGNPAAGYEIRGNPDLHPESSWAYALGTSWGVGAGIVVDVDLYRNDIHDLIELVVDQDASNESGLLVFTPINITSARTQGVEFAARWAGGPWRAMLGYNYLDAKNRTNDVTLSGRAPNTALLRLTRTASLLQGLRADLTGRYTDRARLVSIDDSGNVQESTAQEAFLAWDAQVALSVTPFMDVSVGGDNLFDEQPEGWTGAVGRRWYLGLRTSVR